MQHQVVEVSMQHGRNYNFHALNVKKEETCEHTAIEKTGYTEANKERT